MRYSSHRHKHSQTQAQTDTDKHRQVPIWCDVNTFTHLKWLYSVYKKKKNLSWMVFEHLAIAVNLFKLVALDPSATWLLADLRLNVYVLIGRICVIWCAMIHKIMMDEWRFLEKCIFTTGHVITFNDSVSTLNFDRNQARGTKWSRFYTPCKLSYAHNTVLIDPLIGRGWFVHKDQSYLIPWWSVKEVRVG